MALTQGYKTYQRGTRSQTQNMVFGNGMSFTEAPLAEGSSRLLINFDINIDTLTLKSRRGIQHIRSIDKVYDALDDSKEIPLDGCSVYAANKVMHDGIEYEQYIIGKPDKNEVTGDFLETGDAWVLTAKSNPSSMDRVFAFSLNALAGEKVYFKTPVTNGTSIHGMRITKMVQEALNLVGCFAFNGDFYYFTNQGQLKHTSWKTTNKEGVGFVYQNEVVDAYSPTASEAMGGLYNALRNAHMYEYTCSTAASYGFTPTGFLPYKVKASGESVLVLRPNVNEEYDYHLTYDTNNAEGEYYAVVMWTNGIDGIFNRVSRDEHTVYKADGNPFIFKGIKLPNNAGGSAAISVWLIPKNEELIGFSEGKSIFSAGGQILEEAYLQGMQVMQTCNFVSRADADATSNLALTKYDLSKCKTMIYWKNRIFCIGAGIIKDGNDSRVFESNIIFASEPNRPDWFAFPVDSDTFDEEIIAAQPMLDNLLIFTHRNLYKLTLSEDGLSWNRQHLQADLTLESWDLNLVQIVKNMVFFKSGNYYYMVVPKLTTTSGAGLSIAPISNPIKAFFEDFENNVIESLDDLYNYSLAQRYGARSRYYINLKLVHYNNYLDYEDVHNVYVFEATKYDRSKHDENGNDVGDTVIVHYDLIYNTNTRNWRVYVFEALGFLKPIFPNAVGSSTFGLISDASLLLYEYVDGTATDVLRTGGADKELLYPSVFPNWQTLDTGAMEQNSGIKKRYREYQVCVNNTKNRLLQFYSGFYLDRETRTEDILFEEIPVQPASGGQKVLMYDAHPVPYGSEDLASTERDALWTELGKWQLNVSQLPETNIFKVRIPTSGKGYLPRIKLYSYNSEEFELLSITTVYRTMYSR